MASSPTAPPTTPSPPPPSLSPPPSPSLSPPPSPPSPSLSPPPSPPSPSLSPPPSSSPLPEPPKRPLSPPPAPTEPSTPKPSNPPPATTFPPPGSSSSSPGSPPSPPSNASPTPPSPSAVKPTPSTRRSPPPPPPPSHSAKEHSRGKDEHSKSPQPDKQSPDSQLPIIIGVVVGVGLFVIILGSVFLYCCMKKKKWRPHHHMQYYADPKGPQDGHYYKDNSNWHNAGQQEEHIIKIPPPPRVIAPTGTAWPSPTPPPGRGWVSPPPPPAPMMSSTEMSSSFSGSNQTPPSPRLGLGFNKSSFSYDELYAATSGFSDANILGQGGFGYVYKGVFPTGKEVAVKQLKSGSKQGEREFQAEVEIISRVHHRYLVSLIGYCIADGQRMLVYEFVPNDTLEYHLHGKGLPTMNWPTRLKIALGSAKGLAYLHEDCYPRIIHRDIKASNILLDYNFDAKVADFGLAKLSEDKNTHVSTRVMGTFGYLAPEYASSGKLTEKSDVFSFGVMLLELITGRRPVDPKLMDDCLVDWARPILKKALEDGDYTMLVDKQLDNNYNPNEMGRTVACAAASIRHSSKKRPKMSQIVRALEGDVSLEDLNEGVKPGSSTVFSSSESSEYNVESYNEDMKKFRKMALGTDTQGSKYSEATSEYGLHPSSSSSSDDGHSQETESTGDQKHH